MEKRNKITGILAIIMTIALLMVSSSIFIVQAEDTYYPITLKHQGATKDFGGKSNEIPSEYLDPNTKIPTIAPNGETNLLFWHFIENSNSKKLKENERTQYINIFFTEITPEGKEVVHGYVIESYKDYQHFGIVTPDSWILSFGYVCDSSGNIKYISKNSDAQFNLSHVGVFSTYNTTTTKEGETTTTATTTTTTTTAEPTTTTTTTTTTTAETDTTTTAEPTTTTAETDTTTTAEPTTTTTTTTTTTAEPTTTTAEPTTTTTTTTTTTAEPTTAPAETTAPATTAPATTAPAETTAPVTTAPVTTAPATTAAPIPQLLLEDLGTDNIIPLDNGMFAYDLGEGDFDIYDADGVPLGYVHLADGESIKEYDIIENLIPLEVKIEHANPKTGDNGTLIWVLVTAGAAALALIVLKSRKKNAE